MGLRMGNGISFHFNRWSPTVLMPVFCFYLAQSLYWNRIFLTVITSIETLYY